MALLRLADGLDVSHASVVRRVEAVVTGEAVELIVTARGDAELERWMLQRKKGLFEEVFGRNLELWILAAGHDEFETLQRGSAGLA